MIEVVKNEKGYMTAVVEWVLCDEYGRLALGGKYLIVSELIIHKELNGYKTLKQFARTILKKAPLAEQCLFVREYKYKGREPRKYTREQFERLAEV